MTRKIPGMRNKRGTGFSLPEALMMIIISSSIMVPIIGTLEHSLTRSKTFGLQTAMQNLAESKMNDLVHRGAFLGESLTGSTSISSYPNDVDPEYHFVVRAEILSNLTIDDGTTDVVQDKKLKSISIEVGLLETEPEIASVTLYTLFAEPPLLPDMLYVADPPNKCIFVLNPKTHQKVNVYSTGSETPYFLAVHPSGEWLAIKAATTTLWMDVRPSSSTCGSYTKMWNPAIGIMNTHLDEGISATGYRTARGMCFTPDGRYLYLSYYAAASSNMRIGRFLIPSLPPNGSMPTFPLVMDGPQWTTDTQNVMEMTMGTDGYVYIGLETTTNTNQCVWRLNTVTNTMEYVNPDWSVVTAARRDEIRGIGTSWDGNEVAVSYDRAAKGVDLGMFLSNSLTHYFDSSVVDAGSNADDEVQGMVISRDNMWWLFPINRSGNSPRLAAIRRSTAGTWALVSDYNGVANEISRNANIDGFINLRQSPNGKEVIADTYDSNSLYFINVKNFIANITPWYSSWGVPAEYSGAKVSDVAGRIAEYVWVGAATTSNNQIGCFDVWGGSVNKGRLDSNKSLTGLTGSVDYMALTSSGDKAYMAYGNDQKIRILNCFDNTITQLADLSGDACQPLKGVWTLDRSLFILASKTADPNIAPYHFTATATNGLRGYLSDANGDIDGTCDIGVHMQGTEDWLCRDIVAMNSRNGIYALFQKSDYSASRLVWIEKSKSRGFTGTEGTLEYKVMNFWDNRFDGFPVGRPWKMALSPDDSLLAFIDPYGNSATQTIRIYDLQNYRFPVQPGCGILRYDSNTGNFAASPMDTPVFLKKTLGNLKSVNPLDMSNPDFPFNRDYPFSFDDDGTTCPALATKSARFFGSWHAPVVHSVGYYSNDGVRVFLKNMFVPTSQDNSDTTGTSWLDTGNSFGRLAVPLNNEKVWFQGEYYSDLESTEMIGWGYSTVAPSGNPSGIAAIDTLPGPVLPTGNGTWNAIHSQDTRAFAFRPTFLAEIVLDGQFRSAGDIPAIGAVSDYNNLTGNSDVETTMCFHRDRGRSYLFILHDSNERVYGLDLFGSNDFAPRDLVGDTSITNNQLNSGTDFGDIAITPDGRRLMVTVNQDVAGDLFGLIFLDLIDLASPTPAFGSGTYCALDPGLIPKCIAVRPNAGFNSNRNTYAALTAPAFTTAGGMSDNQRCALASGGIYAAGGTDGYDDVATKTFVLFDPLRAITSAKPLMGGAMKQGGLVGYGDNLYYFGGKGSAGVASAEVKVFNIPGNTWSTITSIKEDTNTLSPMCSLAAVQTPYGMVVAGGGQSIEQPYYHHSITDFSNATHFARAQLQLNGSARYNGTELEVGYDTNFGSAWLKNGILINANTSFKCFFTAKTKAKDGMVFVVRKNADTDTAAGAGTNGMGYRNLDGAVVLDSSVGVVLDTKDNGDGEISNDYVCIRYDGDVDTGVAPPVTKDLGAGYLGGDTTNVEKITHWWIEYDGVTNIMSVFYGNSVVPDRNTAAKAFDYTYDLFTKLGSRIQVGFTGASNTAGGYMRVTRWDFDLYDRVNQEVFNQATFPTAEPYSVLGDCELHFSKMQLTGATANMAGAFWYQHPIFIDTNTSFSTYFVYTSNGVNQADGFHFVLQGNGPTQIGGLGIDIGYGGSCANSLAVEFDCYQNAGIGDADGNHVGVHMSGDMSSHLHQAAVPFATYNFSGSTLHIWVDYDGPTNSLTVKINSVNNKATAGFTTTYTNALADLPTRVGGDHAWFGFTGGTGAAFQEHEIVTWKLNVTQQDTVTLTNAAKVYYPQCNTGNTTLAELGETLSMTSLPETAKDGVLVPHYSRKDRGWHLYYIGAGTGNGAVRDSSMAKYNFGTGIWTPIDLGDTDDTERTGVAACSWGDEIFMFGGARGGAVKGNAIAYNPDNGKFRSLAGFTTAPSTPSAVAYQSAVPIGPHIYLIGGATAVSGTNNGTTYVYRYTP